MVIGRIGGVTLFHYTHRAGYNGIRAGNPYVITPGSRNAGHGFGPFFTSMLPSTVRVSPKLVRKLGLTRRKAEYTMEATIPSGTLKPIRGDRGDYIRTASNKNVTIPRVNCRYLDLTQNW